MGVNIPHYVREFNAPSMEEAIHTADQHFRAENVTVSVWHNRVDVLNDEVKRVRQNTNEIIGHMRRDIFFYTSLSQKGDARLMLNAKENLAKISNSLYFDLYEMWQKTFFGTEYQRTNLQQIGHMNKDDAATLSQLFQSALGSLSYQQSWVDTGIHQDDFEDVVFDPMSDKLFFGGGARTIENIKGEPTVFFETEAGDKPYELPPQSMGFFLPHQAGAKAAWHRSGGLGQGSRLRFVCDLII